MVGRIGARSKCTTLVVIVFDAVGLGCLFAALSTNIKNLKVAFTVGLRVYLINSNTR